MPNVPPLPFLACPARRSPAVSTTTPWGQGVTGTLTVQTHRTCPNPAQRTWDSHCSMQPQGISFNCSRKPSCSISPDYSPRVSSCKQPSSSKCCQRTRYDGEAPRGAPALMAARTQGTGVSQSPSAQGALRGLRFPHSAPQSLGCMLLPWDPSVPRLRGTGAICHGVSEAQLFSPVHPK